MFLLWWTLTLLSIFDRRWLQRPRRRVTPLPTLLPLPMSRIDRSVLPLVTGSGVLSLVDGLAAVHVVTGHLAGRAGAPPAAHIEASAGRAVAAAFPHPQGRPGGQGAVSARGRKASTLRPLSPYGPDKRGLPPFPRFPALRFCCSSGRNESIVPRIGGQGAWQPSLRSGRLRRPAR